MNLKFWKSAGRTRGPDGRYMDESGGSVDDRVKTTKKTNKQIQELKETIKSVVDLQKELTRSFVQEQKNKEAVQEFVPQGGFKNMNFDDMLMMMFMQNFMRNNGQQGQEVPSTSPDIIPHLPRSGFVPMQPRPLPSTSPANSQGEVILTPQEKQVVAFIKSKIPKEVHGVVKQASDEKIFKIVKALREEL